MKDIDELCGVETDRAGRQSFVPEELRKYSECKLAEAVKREQEMLEKPWLIEKIIAFFQKRR